MVGMDNLGFMDFQWEPDISRPSAAYLQEQSTPTRPRTPSTITVLQRHGILPHRKELKDFARIPRMDSMTAQQFVDHLDRFAELQDWDQDPMSEDGARRRCQEMKRNLTADAARWYQNMQNQPGFQAHDWIGLREAFVTKFGVSNMDPRFQRVTNPTGNYEEEATQWMQGNPDLRPAIEHWKKVRGSRPPEDGAKDNDRATTEWKDVNKTVMPTTPQQAKTQVTGGDQEKWKVNIKIGSKPSPTP